MRDIFFRSIKNIYGGRKDLRILDIGCGTGALTKAIEEFGDVSRLDIESKALEFCRIKGAERLIQGDGNHLPFKDNLFDLVTVFNIIEHVNQDIDLIKEVNRVCRDKGRIILATSAFNFLWSRHDIVNRHRRRYTKEGLEDAIKRYFAIEKITYTNFFLFPFIWMGIIISNITMNYSRNASSGFHPVPGLVNYFLTGILKIESLLLGHINFPFGVSLLCIARKDCKKG